MAINKKIPQSRLMIQYDTRVEGERKKKELPYKVLMMANISNGTSKDAQQPLQDRQIRNLKNGIDATLNDMNISIKMDVPNYINPKKSATIDVEHKLSGMKDFRPDQIAEKVPQIKALLKFKEMLISFEKDIDNNRSIKDSIDQVFSNKDQLEQLKNSLPDLQKYSFIAEKSAEEK